MKWYLWLLPVLCLTGGNVRGNDPMRKEIRFAEEQVGRMLREMEKSGKILSPRTTDEKGTVRYTSFQDWTSGFFPGTLWYLYRLTGKEEWKKEAEKYTEALEKIQYLTWHHDIGFMIGCSYGNGYHFGNKENYGSVVIQA
ncbi:MAG: glucuronyl hydrolase, partial [Odoribacter sp.]|nr:glucuronyl hydrolase [Odoribacter sp.]